MHPILFRIPLPHMPLKLWWAPRGRGRDRGRLRASSRAVGATAAAPSPPLVVALAAGAGRVSGTTSRYEAPNVPIYAYGVMLGVSLVVGWYLTLPLAERDGLPKETMANCYVVTALAALAGSRILYAVTNPDEFKSVWRPLRPAQRRPRRLRRLPRRPPRELGVPGAEEHPPARLGRRRRAEPRLGADDHAHRLLPLRLRLRQAPSRRRAAAGSKTLGHLPPLGGGHARERRRQPGVRSPPRGLPRHAARGGARSR